MLKNDDLVVDEKLLLPPDIDVIVRVRLVEIVEGDGLDVTDEFHEVTICPRLLVGGMGEEDEDRMCHGRHRSRLKCRSRAVRV